MDYVKILKEAVDDGLKKGGLPNTPENRFVVICDLHKRAGKELPESPSKSELITTMENEIVRLENLIED